MNLPCGDWGWVSEAVLLPCGGKMARLPARHRSESFRLRVKMQEQKVRGLWGMGRIVSGHVAFGALRRISFFVK